MDFPSYKPPFLLRNGHLNTIYSPLFRRQASLAFQRERVDTPDDDFLDIDWLKGGHRRLAVLCHGLEGSSDSQYIIGTARLLHDNDWDVLALNYRACSGEMNRQPYMYHSGATADLAMILEQTKANYDSIVLVGFSLGANLATVYCGQQAEQIDSKIKTLIAISVPTNLLAGVRQIMRPSNFIYQQRFLKSLRAKAQLKAKQYPDIFTSEKIRSIKNIYQFDDLFTGPISGFRDAEDYYRRCSSGQFIPQLRLPTLIVNALDDPFLPEACYPIAAAAENEQVTLLTPKYGGHVGFVQFGKNAYWEESLILKFINQYA